MISAGPPDLWGQWDFPRSSGNCSLTGMAGIGRSRIKALRDCSGGGSGPSSQSQFSASLISLSSSKSPASSCSRFTAPSIATDGMELPPPRQEAGPREQNVRRSGIKEGCDGRLAERCCRFLSAQVIKDGFEVRSDAVIIVSVMAAQKTLFC